VIWDHPIHCNFSRDPIPIQEFSVNSRNKTTTNFKAFVLYDCKTVSDTIFSAPSTLPTIVMGDGWPTSMIHCMCLNWITSILVDWWWHSPLLWTWFLAFERAQTRISKTTSTRVANLPCRIPLLPNSPPNSTPQWQQRKFRNETLLVFNVTEKTTISHHTLHNAKTAPPLTPLPQSQNPSPSKNPKWATLHMRYIARASPISKEQHEIGKYIKTTSWCHCSRTSMH
jgi:hypothetical protein